MKKLSLLLFALTLALGSFAHYSYPLCNGWLNGRYSFTGDLWIANQYYKVHINTTGIRFANGSQDSVLYCTGSTVSFTIPQPLKNSPVSITVYYNTNKNGSGGNISPNTPISTNSPSCQLHMLPVIIVGFRGERVDNNISLSWTTTSETNNKGWNVQGSIDGKTYNTIAFIPSYSITGNSSTSHDYSITLNNLQLAGFGTLAGLFIILLAAGTFKKYKMLILASMLTLISAMGFLSCSKSSKEVVLPKQGYIMFRLQQIDFDGNYSYSDVRVIR